MPKMLASKITKEILTEAEIKERKLKKDDFTEGFKGRVLVLIPEKSEIAQKLNIKHKGNFAIKTK